MSDRCSSWPKRVHRSRRSLVDAGASTTGTAATAPCNLFVTVEPLAGWRHVEVTDRRTAVDFAHQMQWLVDEAYPNVQVVRVVLDNLNVHVKASLYAAFPAAEARRIAKKLEFHHTPKHGSWLDVAECELAVLASQCLARRLPDINTVRHEIADGRDSATWSVPPSSGTSPPPRLVASCNSFIRTRHDPRGSRYDL